VARYEFRCPQDGPHEVALPLGQAPARRPCPVCGGEAVRVFSPPHLALAPRHLLAAIDRAERSRTEPAVVTAPAGRPRRRTAPPTPQNPAWQRLPRP
jgi:hypothetical protein